jgi:hypothetical protein
LFDQFHGRELELFGKPLVQEMNEEGEKKQGHQDAIQNWAEK